jgi:hypothetical protein
VGLPTLGLRGFFAELIASFMALAPVRSANRAIALSERWSERLKIATYACLAKKARQYTGRRVEKVAIGAPASGIDKYLTWPALHLFDSAHTDQSGVYQIGVGFQGHHIALTGSRYWRPSGYAAFPSQTSLATMSAMPIHKDELTGYFLERRGHLGGKKVVGACSLPHRPLASPCLMSDLIIDDRVTRGQFV